MTPFARVQLDAEQLQQRSRSVGAAAQNLKIGSLAETVSLLRADSQIFADVCLADPPRSLTTMTRTSASSTPLRGAPPLQPPTRTPSPAPRPKSQLPPASKHSRHLSEASSSGLVEPAAAPARLTDPVRAKLLSGIVSERSSWNSEDIRTATGIASSSGSQLKDWVEGAQEREKPQPPAAEPAEDAPQEKPASKTSSLVGWFYKDPLLALTILGVLIGIVAGLALRPAHLSPPAIEVLGFPGEIMLRLLKMLVLPLVAGSMVAGVCALRGSTASMAKIARYTLLYYAFTTLSAVVLGIILVNAVWPGRGEPLGNGDVGGCRREAATDIVDEPVLQSPISPLTALLGVARNLFPDNVALAAVNMNILGIITFSLFFGLALATLGDAADSFVHGIDVFNRCISKMVGAVLWVSPIGIASLIAASIVSACDLLQTLFALGLWVLTVLLGLGVFAGIFLPLVLWSVTRISPLKFLNDFSQAIVLAFGTSSSSAALPVAMECAAKAGCEDSLIKFVLPLGTTVNMNGTALYEATTVIFIAQAHGVPLGLAGTLVVACTATLAAIGAAAIPSAGLVTMLMVLQAVSLERFAADLAIILAIDWLLDRCRTAVNLMSDAMAVVVVHHLCKRRQDYSQIEIA